MAKYGVEGSVAWVTGASGTIGQAICQSLAQQGVKLGLTSRSETALLSLERRLPGTHIVSPADITVTEDVMTAAQRVVSEFGAIDFLINSTTCPIFRGFLDLDDSDWLAVLNAKLLGYVRACKVAIPIMMEAGRGSIVNISGRGGHQPLSPSHMAGSCANGAVDTLTKGLAHQYRATGIRVNAVAPGPVKSARYDQIAKADRHLSPTEPSSEYALGVSRTPVAEIAPAEAIADVVLFLVSDMSRHLTGTIQHADGGGTASL